MARTAKLDWRQLMAAFLTMSMFAMLGNMINHDLFNSLEMSIPETFDDISQGVTKLEEQTPVSEKQPMDIKGPWREITTQHKLIPCWAKLDLKERDRTKGFVNFSLTSGPEFHVSQVTAAVVIARYLRATLVLPDIRGNAFGQIRNFHDMYDSEKFVKSLHGVIKISKEVPPELATQKPSIVKVPNRVSDEFFQDNIAPVFQSNKYLRLMITFPSINMEGKEKYHTDVDSAACLAMFDALELKPDIRGVADLMVERLQNLSVKSDGRFIAVDLRIHVLKKKTCIGSGSKNGKNCYDAGEIGEFLRKIGFDRETVIYLTQTWWHESLTPLKAVFPKTYTKDDIIPVDKKGYFLLSGRAELERALDLHICTHSDVFVPAISGLFYGTVVGKRIAYGKTGVLVPTQLSSSTAAASDFISTYITRKNHLAYYCYC